MNDAGIAFKHNVQYQNVVVLQQHEISMLIKELINNVVKHSSATQVKLSVTQVNRMLKLSVVDNGRGLSGNLSLKSIEARVAAMNGIVETKHLEPGLGVYVTVEVKS